MNTCGRRDLAFTIAFSVIASKLHCGPNGVDALLRSGDLELSLQTVALNKLMACYAGYYGLGIEGAVALSILLPNYTNIANLILLGLSIMHIMSVSSNNV